MSKIEERHDTKCPNLLAFHSPIYNIQASSMLRNKTHKRKKKTLACFKVTEKFQYIIYIICLYIPT